MNYPRHGIYRFEYSNGTHSDLIGRFCYRKDEFFLEYEYEDQKLDRDPWSSGTVDRLVNSGKGDTSLFLMGNWMDGRYLLVGDTEDKEFVVAFEVNPNPTKLSWSAFGDPEGAMLALIGRIVEDSEANPEDVMKLPARRPT